MSLTDQWLNLVAGSTSHGTNLQVPEAFVDAVDLETWVASRSTTSFLPRPENNTTTITTPDYTEQEPPRE
ncbi:hypothetical protein N7461_005949 [Penicillium sp. DV-2018c]|nr:hypothetical protein N7461_005949 [Penicillium sp. DV-2018c]